MDSIPLFHSFINCIHVHCHATCATCLGYGRESDEWHHQHVLKSITTVHIKIHHIPQNRSTTHLECFSIQGTMMHAPNNVQSIKIWPFSCLKYNPVSLQNWLPVPGLPAYIWLGDLGHVMASVFSAYITLRTRYSLSVLSAECMCASKSLCLVSVI